MADISNTMDDVSPEELESLKDMFGPNSSSLQDQLRLSRLKALQQSLGKPLAQDMVNQASIPGSNAGYTNSPVDAQEIVNSQSVPGKTAADSAQTFQNMPKSAAESAETLQNAPELPASQPAEAATDVASDTAADAGGEGLASIAGRGAMGLASKAVLPATVAYELLKSTPAAAADLDERPAPRLLPLPNGGLTGQSLDDAIKQNGGPTATTGFNPSAPSPSAKTASGDDQDDSEDDSSDDKTNSPASLLSKYKNLQKNPTANPASVRDTLAKLLGQNNDDLANAQKQRNDLQLLAILGKAGAQAGAALTPLAHTMPDNSTFDTLMKAAQQPITDIQTKQALGKEALQSKILQGQAQTEIEKTDPSSAISKAAQAFYKQTTGKDADPSMSAADLEKLDPQITRIFTAQQNALNRRAMIDASRNNKLTDIRNKVDQHVGDMLESSRQTPDVKQAYLDSYSASKALTLLNKYPDLNKVSNEQAGLITAEVAKIAQGGVPQMEELKALKPGALPQWFAKQASKLTNDPTPANAGAFLKQYKDYLVDLKTNAMNVVNDKVGRVLDVNQTKMNPDTYKLYKDKYLKPLEDQPAQSSNNEMVNVISPDGQPGQIPKANLNKALSRGFKVQ